MRALLSIAFALLVGVVAFLAGVRWGPQLTVGDAPFHESTRLCSAPEGKPFRIGG